MSFPGSSPRAPLLWLLLPYMVGISLAGSWSPTRHGLAWIAAVGILPLALGWRSAAERPIRWALVVVPTATLAGFINRQLHHPEPPAWTATPREIVLQVQVEQTFPGNGKSWSGIGRITSAPDSVRDLLGQRLYFAVTRRTGPPPCRTGTYTQRGVLQQVTLADDAQDFGHFLDAQGIRLALTRGVNLHEDAPPDWTARRATELKTRLEAILGQGIGRHPSELALYRGMLLGEKATLDREQMDAFQRSGTFHIFVIAGLHIGVVATAIHSLLLLLRLPRRAALVAGLMLLGLYVEVTGAGLPARRAFSMISLLICARVFRLPHNGLAFVTATAFGLLLWAPNQLDQAGFQMSFAVVGGLILMGVPLGQRWQAVWRPWSYLPPADQRWWQHLVRWAGRAVLQALAISTVAMLASAAPLIAHFGVFSPGSLLANLAIVPLAHLAISAGFASMVLGLLSVTAGSSLFNHAAVVLIKLMEWIVTAGTRLPGVYWPAAFRHPALAPVALTLVVAAMLAGASTGWNRRYGAFWWPAGTLALVLIFGVKFG